MEARLRELAQRYAPIGDVRGRGLYWMLDIVDAERGHAPDFAMAERIRYNALLEGLVLIAVKNFIRLCPALIITEAEIDETLGRLETAIKRALDGLPKDLEFSSSSSLAARAASRAH